MANRWFNQFGKTLEKEVVNLYGKVSFGTTGAPTLVASVSKGFSGFTRGTQGNFNILLSDTYNAFLGFEYTWDVSGVGFSPTPLFATLSGNFVSNSTPKITVQVIDTSAAAQDPPNGMIMWFHLIVKNSSAF